MARTATTFALHLDIDGGPNKMSQRVSAALVHAIAAGQLVDGDVLPSTRTLAQNVRIARAVVVEAYDELVAAGFLESRPGSATRVGRGAVAAAQAGAFASTPTPATGATVFDDGFADVRFNLLPGFPDTGLIDARDWNRSWRSAAAAALQTPSKYRAPMALSPPAADVPPHAAIDGLRVQLADHLRLSRGMRIDPADIFIFPGVNAAIRTVSAAVRRPGHTLAFEDPGYPSGRRAFITGGSDVRPVRVDEDGVVVEELHRCDYGVYVTPAHQYPLGSRLSVIRRAALLDWATTHSAVIFEDDYDGEFRYDVARMPALRAMSAGADRVIYLGTTSKILTRDMRIAWAVVPSWLRDTITQGQVHDGESVNAIAAAALSELIRTGALRRQLASSHRTYAARRDRFAAACSDLLPAARLHGVDAGLHVVLTFGPGFQDITATQALRAAGVACAPLSRYFDHRTTTPMHGLVCGYSRLPETHAAEAVSIIRAVLDRQ